MALGCLWMKQLVAFRSRCGVVPVIRTNRELQVATESHHRIDEIWLVVPMWK